jgi:hypothetical protein
VTPSHEDRKTVIIPSGGCVIMHALLAHAGSAYKEAQNCRLYIAAHTEHCILLPKATKLISSM